MFADPLMYAYPGQQVVLRDGLGVEHPHGACELRGASEARQEVIR